MKPFTCISACCFSAFVVLSCHVSSGAEDLSKAKTTAAPKAITVDNDWLPISDQQIKKQIWQNRKSPLLMYRLLRQVAINHKLGVAHDLLKPLAFKEWQMEKPTNPLWLLAYGDTFKISLKRKVPPADLDLRGKMIEKVIASKKHLWFAYLVKARANELRNPPIGLLQGVKLLEESVRLEPDISITHLELSKFYGNAANNDVKNAKKWRAKADKEVQLAYKLQPSTTHICAAMYALYKWNSTPPNPQKARVYAQQMAQMIPPQAVINQKTQLFLSNYGITVDKDGKLHAS